MYAVMEIWQNIFIQYFTGNITNKEKAKELSK